MLSPYSEIVSGLILDGVWRTRFIIFPGLTVGVSVSGSVSLDTGGLVNRGERFKV